MNGFHEICALWIAQSLQRFKRNRKKKINNNNDEISGKKTTKPTDGEIKFDVVVIAFEISVCKMSVLKVS